MQNISSGFQVMVPIFLLLPQRETYMDKRNNNTACNPCKKCGPTQVPLLSCKPNRNRQCGCEPGKFHDSAFLFCKDCTKCDVGKGVESKCTQTSDTKCQPCPQVCILAIISPFRCGVFISVCADYTYHNSCIKCPFS